MNKKIFKHSLLALSLLLFVTSCSDKFGDDLRGLGNRVEVLENNTDKLKTFNKDIETLQAIVLIIQKNGYISSLTDNGDGSFTIIMTYVDDDGNKKDKGPIILRAGADGADGADGAEATLIVSVKQDPYDGEWYWTLNGDWLRDAYGNRVRAGGRDGKDGKDGKDGADGQDGVVPQVRINSDGMWEYSPDGGTTWISTGQPANGKDGKDGKDGRPDIFQSIKLSEDGKSIIITLTDGRTFELPLQQG